MLIDKCFAENFAKHWIDSWNAHDLKAILSHYTDDFEMVSPIIAATEIVAPTMEVRSCLNRFFSML